MVYEYRYKKSQLPRTIYCQFCGQLYYEFAKEEEIPKSFVCESCGTGQQVVRPVTVRSIAGRNATGHYLAPSGGPKK